MKLLFDTNLSPRLVSRLADLYPGSIHVEAVGLAREEDSTIWAYAAANQLVIASKDSDFHHRSLLRGHPPKVIWIKVGNCSTKTIEMLLRQRHEDIAEFCGDAVKAFLALS